MTKGGKKKIPRAAFNGDGDNGGVAARSSHLGLQRSFVPACVHHE